MHICIYVYITYVSIHIYVCMYICIYMYDKVCANEPREMYTYILCIRIHIYVYIHMNIYIYICTYMYIYMIIYNPKKDTNKKKKRKKIFSRLDALLNRDRDRVLPLHGKVTWYFAENVLKAWRCYRVRGWLRLVCSLILEVSTIKEPYKREYILQNRPVILRSLHIVATPYEPQLRQEKQVPAVLLVDWPLSTGSPAWDTHYQFSNVWTDCWVFWNLTLSNDTDLDHNTLVLEQRHCVCNTLYKHL